MPIINIKISEQKIQVENGDISKIYPISTSKFGMGTEKGSNKTPLGNFIITHKIGGNEPSGTIFKARVPVGVWDGVPSDQDFVLTRILWLAGIDAENCNTESRFIYIHGTNQEDLIGTPASHGCIRMLNKDIIELFDMVPDGTKVSIVE